MASDIAALETLIEQGKEFTFDNFAATSPSGSWADILNPAWLVWTFHVSELAEGMVSSPIKSSVSEGLTAQLVGNGKDAFTRARTLILNGLEAQLVISKPRIPASDRVVSLGHNSAEQVEVLAKVDALIEAVERANDLPGSAEDKEQVIAELSAGRRILEAAQVRIESLRAVLQKPVTWIMEKGAGAVVGKAAGALWDYLISLKWL
jgi:hypothetical protein